LARSGVWAGSDSGKTTAGIVSHQKTETPATAAIMKPKILRRSIHQSVTSRSIFKLAWQSMEAEAAGKFLAISAPERE
jgi:thymidine kinase